MTPSTRLGLVVVLVAATAQLSCATARPIPAKDGDETAVVSGAITISGTLLAAGVGYKWGRGTLFYHGEEVRFCIRGLSIGDVGAAKLAAQGAVFNLTSLDDFPGEYVAISIGSAIARGESAALIKNKRGVTMQLQA